RFPSPVLTSYRTSRTMSDSAFLRPRTAMDSKRKVEVFSAGCAFCHEVIDVVRREASSSSQIIVHNMTDARSLARAEQFISSFDLAEVTRPVKRTFGPEDCCRAK